MISTYILLTAVGACAKFGQQRVDNADYRSTSKRPFCIHSSTYVSLCTRVVLIFIHAVGGKIIDHPRIGSMFSK